MLQPALHYGTLHLCSAGCCSRRRNVHAVPLGSRICIECPCSLNTAYLVPHHKRQRLLAATHRLDEAAVDKDNATWGAQGTESGWPPNEREGC